MRRFKKIAAGLKHLRLPNIIKDSRVGTQNVLSPCRSGALPRGTRRVGRSATMWLDSVEVGLKTIGFGIEDESHRIGTNVQQSQINQSSWTVAPAEKEKEQKGLGQAPSFNAYADFCTCS